MGSIGFYCYDCSIYKTTAKRFFTIGAIVGVGSKKTRRGFVLIKEGAGMLFYQIKNLLMKMAVVGIVVSTIYVFAMIVLFVNGVVENTKSTASETVQYIEKTKDETISTICDIYERVILSYNGDFAGIRHRQEKNKDGKPFVFISTLNEDETVVDAMNRLGQMAMIDGHDGLILTNVEVGFDRLDYVRTKTTLVSMDKILKKYNIKNPRVVKNPTFERVTTRKWILFGEPESYLVVRHDEGTIVLN